MFNLCALLLHKDAHITSNGRRTASAFESAAAAAAAPLPLPPAAVLARQQQALMAQLQACIEQPRQAARQLMRQQVRQIMRVNCLFVGPSTGCLVSIEACVVTEQLWQA
jgi:hypothetical protein